MMKVWLPLALLGFAVGCSSGAHSTATRPQTAVSQPIYLAQISCWDTESCCIIRDPLTAANRCMASPERIAEVLNGVRIAYEATKAEDATLKEDARASEEAEYAEAEGEAAPEPPDCQGQNHHVISRPIAKALNDHRNLRGIYEPRDARYVAKAKDQESHCGYQRWHREVDLEVMRWLRRNEKATREQFEALLRAIYNRPDMLKRFPNGFGPGT
ncbi:Wall-associated protein precursor [Myxococcaceae bacterium GXIMD 01537]